MKYTFSPYEIFALGVIVGAAVVIIYQKLVAAYRFVKRFFRFKNFKNFNSDGYIERITPSGRTKLEHREVAEQILGRSLVKGEVVHHINGKRADNRPENLCVMPAHEHERYHKCYDWVYNEYGKYPRRQTQLKKLTQDFRGILLADLIGKKLRKGS